MTVDLNKLIDKYGKPKAIIDYPNCKGFKKIIFDFEETICLDHEKNIIINGIQKKQNIFEGWQQLIEKWKENTKGDEISALGFFAYDFKNLIYPDYKFTKKTKKLTPYFWFGKPGKMIDVVDTRYYFEKQGINIKKDLNQLSAFEEKIEDIKNFLYSGDAYQINYTQPLIFNFDGNPLDLYMQIQSFAKSEFGFYLDIEESQILSFTPEKFFTKKNHILKSFPIKGTIDRGENNKQDQSKIKELSESAKDKAEHLMIVDLLRNDIGKISEFGSINVKDLFSIKTFETIHHMETEVEGTLKKNIREIDIIKSLFPGGSITGAPKYRAVQIIDELENYNRGIYTGCIGTITANGNMDFNICIRTMTVKDGIAEYPVGGGIVWDSNYKSEYLEAREKANILRY